MITWGISANSHDAAIAVFQNEKLVFASHSERFSRKKNDGDLCLKLVDYAKRWGEPDHVYWYENPYLKTLRQFYAGQGLRLSENNVKQYLNKFYIDAPVSFIKHHHSHASAGYYTSKFRHACILVIDAIGEFETITIWEGNGNKVRKVYSKSYPDSIGLWYSAMTQRIGLKPNEEEYILMGLSAFGDPDRFYESIRNDFIKDINTAKFSVNLHRGCQWWRPELTEKDYADIAAATQRIYKELLDHVLRLAKRLVPSDNLVFMGGCALNCSANIILHDYFKNVWIMPNPGDAGSSIGAVLAHWQEHIDWTGPYLGFNMQQRHNNQDIISHLLKNPICGVARGPAEFGPRALGNRSVLADPRLPDIKNKLNKIKQRQEYRPFAPVILAEHAHDVFEMPEKEIPYMQYAVKCKHPDMYPGIVHVDGTSRVQTVTKEQNSHLYNLLLKWYNVTGCPLLVNTSLNIKGEPIVNDHVDAQRWEEKYKVKVFC